MSTDQAKPKSTIENTLFGFLISLTLKAALDTAYGHSVPTAISVKQLWEFVDVPATGLVIIFLSALLRFVFGAYRFHEEVQEPNVTIEAGTRLWNLFATLVLFILFYLTGLSIQHAQPFSFGLICIHAWDLAWFVVILSFSTLPNNLRSVMKLFVAIDVATIIFILLASVCLWPDGYRTQLMIGMVILALLDVGLNWRFFLQPAKWRARQTKEEVRVKSSAKRVYFAAPLFTQAEWLWNQQLASKLVELGIDVVLPQSRAVPMLTGQEKFDPALLFRANLEEIDKADLVLAILDQADSDSGTCFECGYAYKVGKQIIGVRTDIRQSGDDPSGVNLMLRQSSAKFVLLPLEKRQDIDWIARQILDLVE